MSSQISKTVNPFTYCLTEEDAASIAALRRRATRCERYGQKEMAWQLTARAAEICNRAMLRKIAANEMEEDIFYIEVPRDFPQEENVGLDLQLRLIAGSPLAQKIIALLEENTKNGGII